MNQMQVAMELTGGLAIFLYGMKVTGSGLKQAAALHMQSLLQRLVSGRLMAMASGLLLAGILQSSSAASVVIIGLTSAGLISMPQALALALGAGIGTTVTPHLVTIRVTDYALIFVIVGVATNLVAGRRNTGWDQAALGFGLIFFGMQLMTDAMEPLKNSPATIALLESASDSRWQVVVAGALMTALVQSSSAIVALTVTLGQQGLVDVVAGLGIVMGANIGTTVTGILSSLTGSREARRVAFTYTFFQITGALVVLMFFDSAARLLSTWPGSLGNQLALAHTIFNLLVAIIFLPVLPIVSQMVLKFWPLQRPEEAPATLGRELIEVPGLALHRMWLVVDEMARTVRQAVVAPVPVLINQSNPSEGQMALIQLHISQVEETYRRVVRSLGQAGQTDMTQQQAHEELRLLLAAAELHGAANRTADALSAFEAAQSAGVRFSGDGLRELQQAAIQATQTFEKGHHAWQTGDAQSTTLAAESHKEVQRQVSMSRQQHFGRVRRGITESVITSDLHHRILSAVATISQHGASLANLGPWQGSVNLNTQADEIAE